MLLANALRAEKFLDTFWQRKPLLLPNALKPGLPTINGDELGWLATHADVESRIVYTDHSRNKTSYRVEHGPFESEYLQGLPQNNWTLLVQDVEKHLPDFRVWFDLVPFVPTWRFDDLMVSFAAPGGSVGPHADNYDVFLCQGEGTRTWRLGDGETASIDSSAKELALLHEFKARQKHHCVSDDVLYVPPGTPHWGVADESCVTYSIGMRAPTSAELQAGADRIFGTKSDVHTQHALTTFYSDKDLKAGEARTGGISLRAIERLRDQNLLSSSLTNRQLVTILGSVVTDPKPWLDPEPIAMEQLQKSLLDLDNLTIHGMARLTTFADDNEQFAFLNGESRSVNSACLKLFEKGTSSRQIHESDLTDVIDSKAGQDFLAWMCTHGAFDLPDGPE